MCKERSWFIRAALIPIIILNLNPCEPARGSSRDGHGTGIIEGLKATDLGGFHLEMFIMGSWLGPGLVGMGGRLFSWSVGMDLNDPKSWFCVSSGS